MTRPAGWLTDPLDDSLVRYWNGERWTFRTAPRRVERAPEPAPPPPPPAPQQVQRPDIAQALANVRGVLLGSMKEVNLLPEHLEPGERVLALTGASGEGNGVLACTDRRLLFLFVGVVRCQFVQVRWNQAKAVTYRQGVFAVYTTKPTKRAVPALTVRVHHLADAQALVDAAQAASSAPRLDVL